MRYTLGQAAKATGKGKTSIQRAIKKGSISAEKAESGEYRIEPSELHRIFPPQKPETASRNSFWNDTRSPGNTAELAARIKGLEDLLAREREALEELRADRDAWKQQATALLSGPHRNRRWWSW